jgi:hypothetical protein
MTYQQVYPGTMGEMRSARVDGVGATAGAGGHSLSTTAKLVQLPPGTQIVQLLPYNYSTAVAVLFALNPYLAVLKTTDALASITDYSSAAQDGDTSTTVTLNSLDTAANNDFLYVGAPLPFRGVAVDVGNTNSNASVLTVKYWNGSTWTSASATDGTASGGATFAQDGLVTWTVPTDWVPNQLGSGVAYGLDTYYWTRWEVSAALDSTVTARSMLALNRSTNYAALSANDSFIESATVGPGGLGCVEALTDAGTASLIVNVGAGMGRSFA